LGTTRWSTRSRPDDLFLDEQENLYIAELGWAFLPTRPLPHFKLQILAALDRDSYDI